MVSPSRGTSCMVSGSSTVTASSQRVGHALPALQLRALVGGQFVPARLLGADGGGAIDLGQPVDMRQLDADAFGAFEHRDRRRGARDQSDHGPRGLALRRAGRVDQRVVDDRRAAHVGDAVLRDQLEDLGRIDLAQADIDAGRGRDRPRKAPAVAVEHRQRPQIHRMLAEIAGEDIADGIEIGAAVMGHDALRIARGARGIAQRNRVPFVAGQPCDEAGIACRDRRLVFDFADPLAARKRRVVDIDRRTASGPSSASALPRSRRKIPDRPE